MRPKKLATAVARLAPDMGAVVKAGTVPATELDLVELSALDHDEQRAVIASVRQGEFLTLKEALIGEWADYESERPTTTKPTPLRIAGVDEAKRFGRVARKAQRHGAGGGNQVSPGLRPQGK